MPRLGRFQARSGMEPQGPFVERASILCTVAVALAASGCARSDLSAARAIGDPALGAALVRANECGACHRIPGISNADGLVGPPLDAMGRRQVIAGLLPNTPENMMRWLRDPQDVVPGGAMPDMELGEDEARNITAYLYTLR